MKKQFASTLLAVRLSKPSIVFAESIWYDLTLPNGITEPRGGGGSSDFYFDDDFGWGIRGSVEGSERLTTIHRFEHKINTTSSG